MQTPVVNTQLPKAPDAAGPAADPATATATAPATATAAGTTPAASRTWTWTWRAELGHAGLMRT